MAVVNWERKKPGKTTLKSFAVDFIMALGSIFWEKNPKTLPKLALILCIILPFSTKMIHIRINKG